MLGCFSLMILTDGGIRKNEVYFVTTDIILAELFIKLSKILWNKVPTMIRYKRGKCSWMKLRIKSTNAAKLLMRLTENKRSIPKFIMMEENLELVAKYLRIIASTDGGVAFYSSKRNDGFVRTERHIIIGCKNSVIRNQIRELFAKLGIKTRIVKEGLRISGRENLEKFRDKVGFIPGCLVTSKSFRWKGYTKNEVLNFMLTSYAGLAVPRNSVP